MLIHFRHRLAAAPDLFAAVTRGFYALAEDSQVKGFRTKMCGTR